MIPTPTHFLHEYDCKIYINYKLFIKSSCLLNLVNRQEARQYFSFGCRENPHTQTNLGWSLSGFQFVRISQKIYSYDRGRLLWGVKSEVNNLECRKMRQLAIVLRVCVRSRILIRSLSRPRHPPLHYHRTWKSFEIYFLI